MMGTKPKKFEKLFRIFTTGCFLRTSIYLDHYPLENIFMLKNNLSLMIFSKYSKHLNILLSLQPRQFFIVMTSDLLLDYDPYLLQGVCHL